MQALWDACTTQADSAIPWCLWLGSAVATFATLSFGGSPFLSVEEIVV